MTVLNPEPCVQDPLELLVDLFRKNTNDYALGNTGDAAECPLGPPRKITVYMPDRSRQVIEKPAICDCESVRFRMGVGTVQCKIRKSCLVRKVLFVNGTYS